MERHRWLESYLQRKFTDKTRTVWSWIRRGLLRERIIPDSRRQSDSWCNKTLNSDAKPSSDISTTTLFPELDVVELNLTLGGSFNAPPFEAVSSRQVQRSKFAQLVWAMPRLCSRSCRLKPLSSNDPSVVRHIPRVFDRHYKLKNIHSVMHICVQRLGRGFRQQQTLFSNPGIQWIQTSLYIIPSWWNIFRHSVLFDIWVRVTFLSREAVLRRSFQNLRQDTRESRRLGISWSM